MYKGNFLEIETDKFELSLLIFIIFRNCGLDFYQ